MGIVAILEEFRQLAPCYISAEHG